MSFRTSQTGANGIGVTDDGAHTLDGTGSLAVLGAGQGEALDQPPDGPRYAAMGNAVTVPVAEWLGARIVKWEATR